MCSWNVVDVVGLCVMKESVQHHIAAENNLFCVPLAFCRLPAASAVEPVPGRINTAVLRADFLLKATDQFPYFVIDIALNIAIFFSWNVALILKKSLYSSFSELVKMYRQSGMHLYSCVHFQLIFNCKY